MFKRPTTATEWSATVAGTLVLAVLGNALWEVAVKPALSAIQYGLLNLFSLGLNGYKDQLYYRISAGMHEHDASQTYVSVQVLIMLLFAVAVGMLLARIRRGSPPPGSPSQPLGRPPLMLMVAAFVLGVVVTTADVVRSVYVHNALAHYSQLRAALGGSVDEQRLRVYDSKLAQVRKRHDFADLIAEMQREADRLKLVRDDFDPW